MGQLIDMTGKKFGRLFIVERDTNRKEKRAYWICRCDCGKTVSVRGEALRNGHTQSCGCLSREKTIQRNEDRSENLIGQTFNKLTVIGPTDRKSGHNKMWKCQCSCENKTIVEVAACNLKNGSVKSCGCARQNAAKTRIKDLTGQRFGRLIAIEKTEERRYKRVIWKCKCDCGKEVFCSAGALQAGLTTSCGCARTKDVSGEIRRDFKAIRRLEKQNSNQEYYWEVECVHCGKKKEITVNEFHRQTMRCDCQPKQFNSIFEEEVASLLSKNNISYRQEVRFDGLVNTETGVPLRIDFYIEDKNYGIEVDGQQHFKETGGGFGAKYTLEQIHRLDNIKNNWCKEKGIPLIRIPYYDVKKITIEDLIPETSKYLV